MQAVKLCCTSCFSISTRENPVNAGYNLKEGKSQTPIASSWGRATFPQKTPRVRFAKSSRGHLRAQATCSRENWVEGCMADNSMLRRRDITNGVFAAAVATALSIGVTKEAGAIMYSGNRFVGRNRDFLFVVPEGFEDLQPEFSGEGLPEEGMPEKRKEVPLFEANFASPDRSQAVTVLKMDSQVVQLSFMQKTDIADFGNPAQVAAIILPVAYNLISVRTVPKEDFRDEKGRPKSVLGNRTYYIYEVLSGGQYIVLSTAAAKGFIYVLAGKTSEGNEGAWEALRKAAESFRVA